MTAGVNGTVVLASAFDGTSATITVTGTGTPTTSTSTSPISITESSTTTSQSSTITTSKPSTTTTTTTTSKAPTISSTSDPSTTSTTSKTSTTTTASPTVTAISQLPSCGQTCFSNLLAQYTTLVCGTSDPAFLCRNVNFGYGIRDCANGACGAAFASTVISFESSYCASATAAH